MAGSRFTTARDVFQAFPTAADDIRAPPTDEAPAAFLAALAASGTPEDGVGFCAYVLPGREAVWWACQCVRTLLQLPPGSGDAALHSAETWVREPDAGSRREALLRGMEADRRLPTTWLALAAGWSGDEIALEDGPVAASPHLISKAARTAILVALARVSAKERATRLSVCLEGGMRLMEPAPR